jgi:2-oxoglutarate dehydrogenase E2 component (dihydrolipoamide succinyltransferase)
MTTEVLMPLMGEGITEATLVKWLKKPGEEVKKEEPLLEVSTDKVDTEIPSPAAGFVTATFAKEGDTVAINSVIAHIAASPPSSAPAPTPSPVPAKVGPAATGAGTLPRGIPQQASALAPVAAEPQQTGGRLRSSPLVRKIAKQHGVDLSQVQGSGMNGRITRRDIDAFLSHGALPRAGVEAGPVAAIAKGASHLEYGRLETKRDPSGAETLEGVPVRREKMSKMRALIAEHMVRSVRTSPHVTTVFEIDMHRCAALRETAKRSWQERHGVNLTFTAFFVHAAVQAIKKHPIVNTSVDGEEILWKDSINVGVAVAIESGLIVPVIRNAGELNLLGVARRINDLATRARSKKLTPEDVQGGTFSITNPGMFGSLVSAPIINQPQVAILSVGAIIKRPVVIDDLIGIRPLVQVGLTFDHRVIDGEAGARYLATFKEILESYRDSEL